MHVQLSDTKLKSKDQGAPWSRLYSQNQTNCHFFHPHIHISDFLCSIPTIPEHDYASACDLGITVKCKPTQ